MQALHQPPNHKDGHQSLSIKGLANKAEAFNFERYGTSPIERYHSLAIDKAETCCITIILII